MDQIACCLVVAVVAHLIFFMSRRVFALTRLVAVVSALALALILGHHFLSNTLTWSLYIPNPQEVSFSLGPERHKTLNLSGAFD